MTMTVIEEKLQRILDGARRRNGCAMIDDVESLEDAFHLLMSPQGREFALLTGFPTLADLRSVRERLEKIGGVYIDSGKAEIADTDCILAAGNTELGVELSGTQRLWHIVALHGAKVRLRAGKDAVVSVAVAADAEVAVINDGTAVVNIERSRRR